MEKFYDNESRTESLLDLAMRYLPKEESDAIEQLKNNQCPLFDRFDFDPNKIEKYLYSIGIDVLPNSLEVQSFIQLHNALYVEWFTSENIEGYRRIVLTKGRFKRFLKDSVLAEIEDYEWDSIN